MARQENASYESENNQRESLTVEEQIKALQADIAEIKADMKNFLKVVV